MPPRQSGFTLQGRVLVIGLTMLACFTLVQCYTRILIPVFRYPEIYEGALSTHLWYAGFLLILLPSFYLPLHAARPSDIATWILYLNVVLPTATMSLVLCDGDRVKTFSRVIVTISAWMLFEFVRKRSPVADQKQIGLSVPFTVVLPVVMTVLGFAIWYLAGFRIDLSFVNVYDRRLVAAQLVEAGSFMGYAIGMMNGCFIPYAIVLGVYYRKRFFLPLVLGTIIAVFSFDGTKGSILIPVALVPIIYLAHIRYRVGVWMCAAMAGMMLVALLEFALFHSDIFANFLIRRQFVLTGMLANYYWDFFSTNPHVLLSDSFLSWLIEPRYDTNVARLIGTEILGNADCNANANLWASAFAHFSYPGIFVASIVAAWLMWIVDSFANSGRFVVASVIAAEMALIWTNGALHTSLLSNGVVGALVLLYFFPPQMAKRAAPEPAARPPHWSLQKPAIAASTRS